MRYIPHVSTDQMLMRTRMHEIIFSISTDCKWIGGWIIQCLLCKEVTFLPVILTPSIGLEIIFNQHLIPKWTPCFNLRWLETDFQHFQGIWIFSQSILPVLISWCPSHIMESSSCFLLWTCRQQFAWNMLIERTISLQL